MTPTDRGSTPPAEAETAELAVVSSLPLTVWLRSAMYTFPARRDVTVGRDRYCDIWLRDTDPATFTLISRVHAILRFDGSHWLVVDKSQNGVFVGGARRSRTAIHGGQSIALGNPHGPQLTFRVPTATATPEPSNPPNEPSSPPTLQAIPSAPATGDSIHTARFARPITPPPVRTPPPPVRRIPPPPHPSEPDLVGRLGDTMRMLLPPRPRARVRTHRTTLPKAWVVIGDFADSGATVVGKRKR
jgi:ABC transport system ATP-binding/permease protein